MYMTIETDSTPSSGPDHDLIEASGLLDLDFYRRQRPNAAANIAMAIEDYLTVGWRNNVDPGPRFCTEYYLAINDDVAAAGVNPLLHFIRYGRAEGRAATPPRPQREAIAVSPPIAPTAEDWDALAATFHASDDEPPVDVVVPVYRGFDETLRCLYSVLAAAQSTAFRLVVVNDCSPEQPLVEALLKLSERGLLDLHRTQQNLGFVGASDVGMRLHPNRDLVLLNSDTEVYGNWLDRLRAAAYRDPRTATVTPLTNNGEICSYPHFVRDNWRQLEVDDQTLDRLAAMTNQGRDVEIPTGVGFCMYIRRACLDAIGLFDLVRFGEGYGEENDLCRRAVKAGWRNILAADVFVRHYGGTSFGESKAARIRTAMNTLADLHPEYPALVRDFIREDPIRPFREALDLVRLTNRSGKGAILFFNHSLGGGTERHAQEMAQLLEEHGTPVFFCRVVRDAPEFLHIEDSRSADMPNLPIFEVARDPGRFVELLRTIGIRHLHIQHLIDMPAATADFIRNVAHAANLAYDVTLHDYAAICPRIVMVDRSGVYCGEPPIEVCEDCIQRDGSQFGKPSVWEWRDRYGRLLAGARRVFVPDTDAVHRLRRFFPTVKFETRPHVVKGEGVGEAEPVERRSVDMVKLPRRIAVLGAIHDAKGSKLLLETARAAKSKELPLSFIVVGFSNRDDELMQVGNIEITGPYQEDEAVARLLAAEPDLVWFPAVWPETFSYTLSAVFEAGLFPIAFDLGALGTRIKAANWGKLWPMEAMLQPARLAEALLREPIPATPPRLDKLQRPDYRNPLASYYDLHEAADTRGS
jgi:GT2 family glycosyltransferase/glycosyltransferase involved in cell wall biosynthesis